MKNITLKKVAEVCRGSLHGGAEREEEATCVVIDSRKLKAGGIFIAARGRCLYRLPPAPSGINRLQS